MNIFDQQEFVTEPIEFGDIILIQEREETTHYLFVHHDFDGDEPMCNVVNLKNSCVAYSNAFHSTDELLKELSNEGEIKGIIKRNQLNLYITK